MKSDAKEKARADLTKMMNEQLLANENINSDIIYTVVFDQWFYSRGCLAWEIFCLKMK